MQRLAQFFGVLAAALHLEAEHAASALHLFHREGPLWMALQERIIHRSHLGMAREKFRNSQRTLILTLNANGKGFDSPQQKESGVRVHHSAERDSTLADFADQIAPSCSNATGQIGMSTEVLGARMKHDVDAKLRWPGIDGGRECGVYQGNQLALTSYRNRLF